MFRERMTLSFWSRKFWSAFCDLCKGQWCPNQGATGILSLVTICALPTQHGTKCLDISLLLNSINDTIYDLFNEEYTS